MRSTPRRDANARRKLRVNRTAFLALVGLVLVVGAAELSGPLGTLRKQRAELARLQEAKETLLAEYGRLASDKRYLATEAGQEQVARERGYLREGERRLRFVPDSEETEPGAPRGAQQPGPGHHE